MFLLSRHLCTASDATIPLSLQHEYREYNARATAWVVEACQEVYLALFGTAALSE